jgi:[protein-PII] uridylyltransferase
MGLARAPLLADQTLTGAAWCRAHSDLVDRWLDQLLQVAVGHGAEGLALVAVGGYGRSELGPQSDIDVMLVHDGHAGVAAVADRVWYPIWDEGLHLGHSVCTVKEAVSLAAADLDTATALLSARRVGGDARLCAELAAAARSQWERRSRQWLAQLAARVEERHQSAGEVSFQLEPDLKDGRGGLRDVHSLRWADAAGQRMLEHDEASLAAAYATLLDARVELQRATARPANVLTLQDQDAVAAALGFPGADALMARVAEAGRAIAWTSDDAWRRVRSSSRRRRSLPSRLRTPDLGPGLSLRDGEIHVDGQSDDLVLALRAGVAAARHGAVIERTSLERLAAGEGSLGDPWPGEARALLVELLLAGAPAIHVIEALDQRGLWSRILPEWQAVRSRPQRNQYHRFTVDRHLLETAANAARLADRVGRPDLLVVAALLHDIGKGHPGDHTEVGMEVMKGLGGRLGFTPEDVAVLVALVEHHLLLADVATRRDLDDPATIERVAEAIVSVDRLHLLAALTEADSLATGPSAWGGWKAELVAQLVDRVAHVLGGGETEGIAVDTFPSPAQLARLRSGGRHIDGRDDMLTVIGDDRPGVFSRVAGVLALHGLDVLTANAYSSDDGRALAEFRVADPYREATPWTRVIADLELALDGRLAVDARVAERAHTYGRGRGPAAAGAVTFDNRASADATVIDVQAPDRIGVLYRITRALADLDLDIRSARVQTLGHLVVDAFYVRDRRGGKVEDDHTLGEIERAILHGLTR